MARKLLLFLLLFSAFPAQAEPNLEAYQERLISREWESASAYWSDASSASKVLLQVDFHQSRGDYDVAWQLLQQLQPQDFSGYEQAYFYLLRARSELWQEHIDLVNRNLKELRTESSSPVLRLRAEEIRGEVLLRENNTRALQRLLDELSPTPTRESIFRKLTAAQAQRDGRWAEAARIQGEAIAWSQQHGSWRLTSMLWLELANTLRTHSPDRALGALRQAALALSQDKGEADSEILAIARTLGFSTVEENFPQETTELRGDLYQRGSSGRGGWYLAGGYPTLPPQLDRREALLKALVQAETAEDHLAAAWLCEQANSRLFMHRQDRKETVARGRRHLTAVGRVPPGPTPFDVTDESFMMREEVYRKEKRPDEFSTLSISGRDDFLQNLARSSPKELAGYIDQHLAMLEVESRQRSESFSALSRLINIGNSNGRDYDPELLNFGHLKEWLPPAELARDRLGRHPQLISNVLRRFQAADPPGVRYGQAGVMLFLGRYQEARRVLTEIELELRAPKDNALRLRVLELYLRSLSKTGELEQANPYLDLLEESLQRFPMQGTETTLHGPLPSIELLIQAGRLEVAKQHLDRMLAAAEGDGAKEGDLAVSSFYVHRAMVGRLLGEPVETTLDFLIIGEQRAEQSGIYGQSVNAAYRAALLAEIGRQSEFLQLFQKLAPNYPAATSRLQLGLRQDLSQGLSLEQAKDIQDKAWREYQAKWGPDYQDSKALRRVEEEVLKRYPVLPVSEVFLQELQPRFLETPKSTVTEVTTAEFFQFASELVERSEGDNGFLLPIQVGYLQQIRDRLPNGAVLYHPILLPNRLVKLQISKERLLVEEFYLDGSQLARDLRSWTELCADRNSSLDSLENLTERLRPVLWSPRLDDASQVWLLAARPLDGIPWPLLAPPSLPLRWSDGDIGEPSKVDLSLPVLAGGQSRLPGTQTEIEALRGLLPRAHIWKPDSGLQGLVDAARDSTILHLTGHGEGLETSGGAEVDLGPLQVGLEGLFSFEFARHPLVVLAICEGGAGYPSSGGRSFSLVTPFRAAQASRVMANIWTLDDRDAADLFLHFYQLLVDGQQPEQALDELRDQAREDKKHPYFWSGLFLVQSL